MAAPCMSVENYAADIAAPKDPGAVYACIDTAGATDWFNSYVSSV